MLETNSKRSIVNRLSRLQNSLNLNMGTTEILLAPTSEEKQRIEICRDKIQSLLDLPSSKTQSEQEWINNRRVLRNNILKRDPRFFLNWPVIRRTMFVEDQPFVNVELEFLRSLKDLKTRWEPAILDQGVGNAPHSRYYSKTNANTLHHAYTLAKYETTTSSHMEDFDVIIEFGGGYGNFCKLCHRLGFKGKYFILDLPEFSILQEYYLSAYGLHVREGIGDAESAQEGIFVVRDLNLEVLSLISKMATDSRKALFVAMWSLSETSLDFRENFAEKIHLDSMSHFLFAHQDRFNEIDNLTWFANFRGKAQPALKWHMESISHLSGNAYSFSRP